MKDLVKEVVSGFGLDALWIEFCTKSTVFQDNQGALTVSKSPRMTPTSKFIALKYHWFCEHVGIDFEIEKVETDAQKADIFTKSLSTADFEHARLLSCGW